MPKAIDQAIAKLSFLEKDLRQDNTRRSHQQADVTLRIMKILEKEGEGKLRKAKEVGLNTDAQENHVAEICWKTSLRDAFTFYTHGVTAFKRAIAEKIPHLFSEISILSEGGGQHVLVRVSTPADTVAADLFEEVVDYAVRDSNQRPARVRFFSEFVYEK